MNTKAIMSSFKGSMGGPSDARKGPVETHLSAYRDLPSSCVHKATLGLLAMTGIFACIGLVASGIAFQAPLELQIAGSSVVQAFVFLASLLYFAYLGVHLHACRKNCPVQIGYGHLMPQRAHIGAVMVARLVMGTWSVALISSSIQLGRYFDARRRDSKSGPSSAVPHLDFVASLLACFSFCAILLIVERAHDPFAIPGLRRQSTLTCRVSNLAANFLPSSRSSTSTGEKKSLYSRHFDQKNHTNIHTVSIKNHARAESVEDEHFAHDRSNRRDIEKYPIIEPADSDQSRSTAQVQVSYPSPKAARRHIRSASLTDHAPLPPPPCARLPAPPTTRYSAPTIVSRHVPSPTTPSRGSEQQARLTSPTWGGEWNALVEETGFESPSPSQSGRYISQWRSSHRQHPSYSPEKPEGPSSCLTMHPLNIEAAAQRSPSMNIAPPHRVEEHLFPFVDESEMSGSQARLSVNQKLAGPRPPPHCHLSHTSPPLPTGACNLLKKAQANLRAKKVALSSYPPLKKSPLANMTTSDDVKFESSAPPQEQQKQPTATPPVFQNNASLPPAPLQFQRSCSPESLQTPTATVTTTTSNHTERRAASACTEPFSMGGANGSGRISPLRVVRRTRTTATTTTTTPTTTAKSGSLDQPTSMSSSHPNTTPKPLQPLRISLPAPVTAKDNTDDTGAREDTPSPSSACSFYSCSSSLRNTSHPAAVTSSKLGPNASSSSVPPLSSIRSNFSDPQPPATQLADNIPQRSEQALGRKAPAPVTGSPLPFRQRQQQQQQRQHMRWRSDPNVALMPPAARWEPPMGPRPLGSARRVADNTRNAGTADTLVGSRATEAGQTAGAWPFKSHDGRAMPRIPGAYVRSPLLSPQEALVVEERERDRLRELRRRASPTLPGSFVQVC